MGRGAAAVDQQSLRGTAHSGAPHLRIEHEALCHPKIGAAIDVHVTHPFQMPDHRHTRLLLHARNQALAAARHQHIDAVRHVGQHMAHRRPIRGGHQLNAVSRQPCGLQALLQTAMNRRAGPGAFRAAAQDHRVA